MFQMDSCRARENEEVANRVMRSHSNPQYHGCSEEGLFLCRGTIFKNIDGYKVDGY